MLIKIILLLMLDQITKIIVSTYISLNEFITIIKNFLYITNVNNSGIAFGLFGRYTYLIIVLNIISLLIIIYYINSLKKSKLKDVTIILLLSGIFSNLIDRIFLGHVRDFISFKLFNINMPIFNVSDVFIFIGCILLIYLMYGEENENKSK